jgi:hypothetical protein
LHFPVFLTFNLDSIKESIHQWLRKVENASDKAIKNTFNQPKSNPNVNATSASAMITKDPYSGTFV